MNQEPCARCNQSSHQGVSLRIVVTTGPVGRRSWGLRWGGGKKHGVTALCADCAWALNEVAAAAVGAEIRKGYADDE